MKEAGLTPMQILQCATANAAKVFDTTGGGNFRSSPAPKIGSVAAGNYADLIILKSNPVEDIARASDIQTVIKNGVVYPADSLLPR
jgi:imidazolonepropionase-like amidohydrolase